MRHLANALYLLLGALYLPFLVYEMVARGKNRRGWRERFGGVAPRDPRTPRVWIHGVSLGEINATPRLVAMIREARPDIDVVISSTTDTGFARAIQHFGRDAVFRFPLDFSWVIGKVLRRTRPDLIILMEQEIWYNLVRMADAANIPVAVVNARMTHRSAGRYALAGPLVRDLFRRLAWVGAQDDDIAARFEKLGVPAERIHRVPSLKWDSAELSDSVDGAEALARDMGIDPDAPLVVCGSTGPGEEAALLDVFEDLWGRGTSCQVCVVPRKPERFDEVAALVASRGIACIRRSRGDRRPPDATRCVLLGDTMGELRKFYSLATVAFVGRSLVRLGGSDPMEVAGLARPVVMGPHVDNFRVPVRALCTGGALEVVDSPGKLGETLARLLADPHAARAMGGRGREVVRKYQGATATTARALLGLLAENRVAVGSPAGSDV